MRMLSNSEMTSVSGGDRWCEEHYVDGGSGGGGNQSTGIWGGDSSRTWSIDLNKSDYQNKMANKSDAQKEQDLSCSRGMIAGLIGGAAGVVTAGLGTLAGGWAGGCLDARKPSRPNNPFHAMEP